VPASAASEVARFGKQFAVLAFSRSFGATLSEDTEFFCVQPLPPLCVREFERKIALRTGHKEAAGWAGDRRKRMNGKKRGNWDKIPSESSICACKAGDKHLDLTRNGVCFQASLLKLAAHSGRKEALQRPVAQTKRTAATQCAVHRAQNYY
jgi:hypothetical protein